MQLSACCRNRQRQRRDTPLRQAQGELPAIALRLPGLQAPLQTFCTAGLEQTGIRPGAEQRLIPKLGGPLQQAGLLGTAALGELHGSREEGISTGDPLEAMAAALQLVHRQGLQRKAGEQQQG